MKIPVSKAYPLTSKIWIWGDEENILYSRNHDEDWGWRFIEMVSNIERSNENTSK